MSSRPTLVWLRRDLRLRDHPALHAAWTRGGAVIPVFIDDAAAEAPWAPGAASRWWLHHSLAALQENLVQRGGRLIVARGAVGDVLNRLVETTGADEVYWSRRYEPRLIARDAEIERELGRQGVKVRRFNSALLHEPTTVANKQGKPFQVFSPFWRTCLDRPVEAATGGPPARWPGPDRWPESLALSDLGLLPDRPWADGFAEQWTPGEAGAHAALQRFLRGPIDRYDVARDEPGTPGTSRLSPHLHFGEISPRQIWAAVRVQGEPAGVFPPSNGARVFLSEVGWREFAYHLLYHFPHTPTEPLRGEFAAFPWRADPDGELLRRWQRGRTGYPIVDAAVRELWATGWMHNRARMIVGSFLVKHLRLPWTAGAAWFWDTLVDADLANNTLGWQWIAGCGADAAPYFRIFNPMTQGAKFDAHGAYVRRWVPELARVPKAFIHAPWTAPAAVLDGAGVELGVDYPAPMVDHVTARQEALEAFAALRQGAHA